MVIGNSVEYRDKSEKWNLYREILADGWNWQEIENNVQEISWSIFKESIDKSKDPFFPNAARDLFAGMLMCLMETGKTKQDFKRRNYYNSVLKNLWIQQQLCILKRWLKRIRDMHQ